MSEKVGDNVRPLRPQDDRWNRIKNHVENFANQEGDATAVAIAGVSIRANGEVTTSALNVEPEHVVPMVAALNRLIGDLMKHLARTR